MEFWNFAKNEETGENELRIDGDIEMDQSFWDWFFDKPDKSANGLIARLNNMTGDLTVWINSNGGEVFAASVIYTTLKNYKGKVTVKIDGTAISAASVIAMAGDEILMSPTAIMMIHNPLTAVQGEVKDMEKAIDILTEVKKTIMSAYKRTGLSAEEISKLMDEETWMSSDKAISMGFADGKLFDESTEPDAMNYAINGAKMIYNSMKREDVEKKVLEMLKDNEATNQQNQEFDNADFFMLKNQLELEKQRF